ncbi:MAG: patatin-like phospholipase family protein [Gammaproteobacteria bacterium]|nr:patatin-like phospholipase family protein [Gammaproteobacteria bacterium]
MERQRVPIDLVVGTGFGGIVGGLYASGMSVSEIHDFVSETDWQNVFDPDTQREDMSFRRKRDDEDFLIKYRVGIKDGQAQLPISLVPNEKLAQLLQSVTATTKGIENFDALPIPFRTVAMDLLTGDEVVLHSGALDRAILATVSSPGTLPPVEIGEKFLITGSLVNNLPVDVARQWGADVIIVVDIGIYIRTGDDLNSIFAIVDQVGHLLQRKNSQASILQLGGSDILIQPDLIPYKETLVINLTGNIDKGAKAVASMATSFDNIRLDAQQYALFNADRVTRRSLSPIISSIELHNESKVDDAVIRAQLTQKLDVPLDPDALERDLRKIFGIGAFSSVEFNLRDQGESTVLELSVVESPAGTRFWRFGISLQDDLNGNSAYTASASMTSTHLNSLGAEWRSVVRIGERQQVSTEFFQPIVRSGRYFVSVSGGLGERNVNSFLDGEIIGQSRVRELVGQLQLGRVFGNSSQLTAGILQGRGSTRSNIGSDIPSGDFDIGGYTAAADYDTFDNIYFPKKGSRMRLEWNGQRKSAGASFDVDIVSGALSTAKSWGPHTIIGGFTVQSQLDEVPGAQNLVSTGGLFQLSGFQRDELSGRHTAVGRAIYYRRIRSNPLRGFLDASLYVGASLELGNAWQNSSEVSFRNTLAAGSLFVGADTFIGPVYLGAGLAEGGHFAMYMYVGRPF